MAPKLNLIAAACENMGIGKNGDFPWRLKSEMAYFTKMTTATKDENKKNVVLMGRKTWDSIPNKYRPLTGRINMVLTSTYQDLGTEAIVCKSFAAALEKIADLDCIEKVWVVGGSSVYKEALESPNFHRLYLTKIMKHFDCDTFFPDLPNNLVPVEDPEVPKGIQKEKGIEFEYNVYEKDA